MNIEKSNSNKFAGTGLLTAVAASLCCITPVLALISGASGIASAFSWMEPLRPFLIGITVFVLGYAWWQKLKPKKKIECACEEDEKTSFWQSKKFLGIVTVFAIVMTAFPYYSSVFYPKKKAGVVQTAQSDIQELKVQVEGMTCESCNLHVENELAKLQGYIDAIADYKTGTVKVKYNKTKSSKKDVVAAVNNTGYKIVGQKLDN